MRFLTILSFFLLIQVFSSVKAQIPELNKKIIEYVDLQMGKKVDRGECWDLAYQALTQNNCEWDGEYEFGRLINTSSESLYPGDLIQFSKVKVVSREGNVVQTLTFMHHTAIVYEVSDNDNIKIAHQNFGGGGKKVGITNLYLKGKVSGKISFYRPVSKADK